MTYNREEFHFETQLVHNRHKVDPATGAVSVPIYHSSTFHQPNIHQFGKYDYSRSLNPTREALEDIIADLEGGTKAFAFASGMAAISTAFLLLSAGDHVIISEDVYGGTYRMATSVLNRFEISHTFVDMTDLKAVKAALRPNTRAVYIETPSNPLLKVTDIRAVSALAREAGALTYVDNTFLTPALQRPLELGADIVLHSATKFLSGHSDAVAGLAVVKNPELAERLGFLQNSFGAVLGVQDAWLVMRGLKTLSVRILHSQQSALKIARWLEEQPLIKQVHYPGLDSHPHQKLQLEQASGSGAVLSFEFAEEAVLEDFVQAVQIPVFAVSLGAAESILSYPAEMSHAAMSEEEREKRGITRSLLRLSVGLENPADIIQDFSRALKSCQKYALLQAERR